MSGRNTAHREPVWTSAATWSIGLFFLALAIRLLYLIDSLDSPIFDPPIVDALKHHKLAQGIASGAGLERLFSQRRPFFYPLFLSGVYLVFGPSILAAKIAQSVLGAFTCLLTYRLGARTFGTRVGVTAGLFVALYGPLFFWELELVSACWATFWSVALTALAVRLDAHPNPSRAALLGACGALSIMTRPGFGPVFAALCIWLVVTRRRRQRTARPTPALALAGLLGFLTIAAPVAALSWATAGRVAFVPAAGGLNLYVGNNPDRCYTLTLRPGGEFFDLAAEPLAHGHVSPSDQSAYFYRRVARFVAEEPAAFLAGLAHKSAQLANGREVPRNVDLYALREWSWALTISIWKIGRFGFPWGLLFPLAVVGLVWRWRELPAPILLFVLLYPLVPILVFVSSRYRVPLVPLSCILAAAACWSTARAFRSGAKRAGAAAVVAATVIAAATNALPPACEEAVGSRSEIYSFLGTAAFNAGNLRLARAHASEALRSPSPSRLAHALMGSILLREGDSRGALEHLDRSLELRESSLPYLQRGIAHLQLSELDAAEHDLRRALVYHPGSSMALFFLGEVHHLRGEIAEARESWRRAEAAGGKGANRARRRLAAQRGDAHE